MRIVGVLIVLVVVVLVWYMALSQPPKPNVVVVKPANQTPAPVTPPGGAPPAGVPGACQAVYMRLGQTELCGDIITVSKYTDRVYIYAQNVWISGPYTISASACPVSVEGGRYVYRCAVEIYIALGTK